MAKEEPVVDQLRNALLGGEALTRIEACDRFGITGSTFRWVIRAMKKDGIELDFTEERGRRNAPTRRWSVNKDRHAGQSRPMQGGETT